jgi:hypothetical protein
MAGDFEHPIERLADGGELVERCSEQFLLEDAADSRVQDDEAGMQRLCCIEAAEVAAVVGNEHEIALTA